MKKKKKKELMASAPWRGEDEPSDKFANTKLKATKESSGTTTMHVPREKETTAAATSKSDENLEAEIDPELRYSLQKNFQFLQQVFSIDTVVKPLPPAMAFVMSRNLNSSLGFLHSFGIQRELQMHRNHLG